MRGDSTAEHGHGNENSDHKIPFLRQNDPGAMRRDKMALAHVQLPLGDVEDPSSRGVGKGRLLAE